MSDTGEKRPSPHERGPEHLTHEVEQYFHDDLEIERESLHDSVAMIIRRAIRPGADG